MKTKLKVVKIGGHVINDDAQLDAFLADFAQLEGPKVLVHGGGKVATEVGRSLGVEAQMVDGRRITTEADLKIVTMVYAGLLNKKIAAKLQALNCSAIGLSGADGNLITSCKRPLRNKIDYGFVGDVIYVNHELLSGLLQLHLTPVICAVTHNGQGQLLNTNADTIASEVAIGMSEKFETELIYCFEKQGVLKDVEDENSVITEIGPAHYAALKAEGKIHSGMIPKLDNCFHALEQQVSKVIIGSTACIRGGETVYTSLSPGMSREISSLVGAAS